MNIFNQSLGTHEFDYGVDSLVPFLNAASFPVVAANLNVSRTNPIWWTIALKRATVIDMHGIKIGVIGYLNPKVNQMITARGLNVTDEITAIKYVKYKNVEPFFKLQFSLLFE